MENKKFKEIDVKYYNDLVNELKNVLDEKQNSYIVLYSPSINEINKKKDNSLFKKILKNKFQNLYDLSEIDYEKKDLYHDHIHLNKKGHEIYSEYIYNIIKRNNLVKK